MAEIVLNLADFRSESRAQLGKLAVPVQRRHWGRAVESEQENKGGAPPKVRNAVTEWFNERAANQRALSATKLEESYLSEMPPRPGTKGVVRKIITRLKAG